MKFEEAKRIGEECGLYTPQEQIRNIIDHAISLFKYDELYQEINELIEDAKRLGIELRRVEDGKI